MHENENKSLENQDNEAAEAVAQLPPESMQAMDTAAEDTVNSDAPAAESSTGESVAEESATEQKTEPEPPAEQAPGPAQSPGENTAPLYGAYNQGYAYGYAAPTGYYNSGAQPGAPVMAYGYAADGAPGAAYSGVAPQAPSWPAAKKLREPLNATAKDGKFALFCVLLGFLFVRWFLYDVGGGVAMFTLLFGAGVLLLARASAIAPPKQSWYWFALMMATGLQFTLWPAWVMSGWQFLLLFGSALLWCASLFGILTLGKVSNYLPLDMLNVTILVPFKNFGVWFQSVSKITEGREDKKGAEKHRLLNVLIGVALGVLLLAGIVPMLMEADGGAFRTLVEAINENFFLYLNLDLGEVFFQLLLGIPVALFFSGLVLGAAHKRYTNNFDLIKVKKGMGALHFAPRATGATLLGIICLVYIVFIACQIPYYFSAFQGVRPEGYEIYSEYARKGFFELCRISAINIGLMALVGSLSKKAEGKNTATKILNVTLSALTILLAATALSKMGLYIEAYGLTPLRMSTSVFIVFIIVVCVGIIWMQRKAFSIVRFSLVAASGILCLYLLANPGGLMVRYNADRYLAGTLENFENYTLCHTGYDGWETGWKLYENASNPGEKAVYENHLWAIAWEAHAARGTGDDNLHYALIRRDMPQLPEQGDDSSWPSHRA